MRIAYFDCASGISGDMTLGALVDVGVELAELQAGIDSLGLPSCRLVASEVTKRGFRATQVTVQHEPEHAHRHLSDILQLLEASDLSRSQRELATRIFTRLGEAEAKVHGTTIEKVHFHEVGAVDSIADIVGTAIGWDRLGVDRVHCSAVPTGSGFIQIAHGRCAVPAPATAELLRGVPLAVSPDASQLEGERTTPTGAAILRALDPQFGALPPMTIEQIGCGAGERDYDEPNLLRLCIGTTGEQTGEDELEGAPTTIVLLETNLDDVTGEALGDCVDRLWQEGALDVATVPIQMKKGRPGVMLSVQAPVELADQLALVLFRHTTAMGVRRQLVDRIVLPRRRVTVTTPWGEAAGMVATLPDGSERFTPEFADCRALADQAGVPLAEVCVAAASAYNRRE